MINEKKKYIFFIFLCLFLIPIVSADRTEGTEFIVEYESFDSCTWINGSTFRIVYCADDVPEQMYEGVTFDLRNYFYWIIDPPFTAAPIIPILIGLFEPLERNYTYSINLPIRYDVSGATSYWFTLNSPKFWNNITLAEAIGQATFDVDYDGVYNLTLYSKNAAGVTSSESIVFIVDRTSEFVKRKPIIVGAIILTLFSIAGIAFKFSKNLDKKFQVMITILSFLFVYSALSLTLLAEREYIKLSSMNASLGTIFSVMIYGAIIIAFIMLAKFILNIINTILIEKRRKRFGE